MNTVLALTLSTIASYMIGSFPTSFILARFFKGVDIRMVGSKNAGATNVFRTVGRIPGLVTLIVDILKGVLVVTLIASFSYQFTKDLDYDFYRCLLGFFVVSGHIWSIFLKFRGGKGVATTLGVAIGIAPLILLPAIVIWVIVFTSTNFVSLASIIALISFPIIACLFHKSIYIIILSVILCMISIYKHKANILRLSKGEENKIILFKK